jgi:ubiquinone biosynthesis protein
MTLLGDGGRPTVADRLVGGPVGFRQYLQRLGPTFVKMGQFLALRPDLVPQAYADELMMLLDHAPPFGWADARRILGEELGADPESIFASIDPLPVGGGSLAQVHLARLDDGTEVAVKILRPGIHEAVQRDLRRARRLTRLLEVSGVRLVVSPREVLQELEQWLLQEIDLAHELANVTRLHGLTQSSTIQRIPRPYPALSTARVLTLEYLRGVAFSEILLARPEEDPLYPNLLGVDRTALAANLLRASLIQIFRARFFHADLHPGNLVALPADVIGFVDFGVCDHLPDTVRERQQRYLSAIYRRDVDAMFRALTEILVPGPETDLEAFRTDFFAETATYLGRSADWQPAAGRTTAGERSPIAEWLIRVVRSARRHRLHFPANVLALYRALLTVETVARRLDPAVDLRRIGREFFRDLQIDELANSLSPERLEPALLNLLTLYRDSPRQLQQILADAAEGRLALSVTVAEGARARRQHDRRAKLVTSAVLSVGVSVLLAQPTPTTLFGVAPAPLLVALLLLLYAVVAWQWYRLRS